jgi:hypothetical protein
MSVAIFRDEELDNLFGQVLSQPKVLDVVFKGSFAEVLRERDKRHCKSMGEAFNEDAFRVAIINGLALRLGVCNKVASAFTYKEPVDFFEGSTNKPVAPVLCTDPSELLSQLKLLAYNLVANDGTTFVPYGWYSLFQSILVSLEPSFLLVPVKSAA